MNKQSRQISERKKYSHLSGYQKSGAFHIRIKKNRVSHILFVEKRGPIIYLAALKKGAILHAHPHYVIYRKLTPPPPPPPSPSTAVAVRPGYLKCRLLGFRPINLRKISTSMLSLNYFVMMYKNIHYRIYHGQNINR